MNHAHMRESGEVRVGLPPTEAFALFTPEGESRWAEGWHPTFFALRSDTSAPGSAFSVAHGDATSTWIVTDRVDGTSIRYARWVNDTIGLVEVTCRPADGGTVATVVYDVTGMTPDGDARVRDLAHHYSEFLGEWTQAIAAMPGGAE